MVAVWSAADTCVRQPDIPPPSRLPPQPAFNKKRDRAGRPSLCCRNSFFAPAQFNIHNTSPSQGHPDATEFLVLVCDAAMTTLCKAVDRGVSSSSSSSSIISAMPGSGSTFGLVTSEACAGAGAGAGAGKPRKRKCVQEADPKDQGTDRNRDAPTSAPPAPSASSDAAAPSSAAAAARPDDAFDPSSPLTKQEKSELPRQHMLTWTLYHLAEAQQLRAMGLKDTDPIVRKLEEGLRRMRKFFQAPELASANEVAERTLARKYGLPTTSAAPCGAPPTKTVVLSASALREVGKFLRGEGLGYIAEDLLRKLK